MCLAVASVEHVPPPAETALQKPHYEDDSRSGPATLTLNQRIPLSATFAIYYKNSSLITVYTDYRIKSRYLKGISPFR